MVRRDGKRKWEREARTGEGGRGEKGNGRAGLDLLATGREVETKSKD